LPSIAKAELRKVVPENIHLVVATGRPTVTVILPCYGQVDHTLNCLASIADHPPRCSIEVLVVEDRSNDPRIEELRRVSGVTLIENPENLGFLRSCNAAARQASGDYLYFLNNDTILAPGALDWLVDFAEKTPDAGLVGSHLIYPDGRQQEAGGLFWNDGSAWNYGRLDDPMKPEYQYVREADYISGASILVPRDIWNQLQGFDEVFSPAYCEDSDFAFRVRAIGKKVYYQPASNVFHFEGISHGTDTTKGGKAFQVVNLKKMAARWGETLGRENFPPGQNLLRARDRARNRKIILVVDHYTPEPDKDAGSRTMIDLIGSLQSLGWIVKFWPRNLQYHPKYVAQLQQRGVEVLYGPYETSLAQWLKKIDGDLDAVLLSRPTVAPHFLAEVRNGTSAPVLYYGHDLHFARLRLEAKVMAQPALLSIADAMEKVERQIWRSVDVVLYPTQEEVDVVVEREPGVAAAAIPAYCFSELAGPQAPPPGKAILFVGGFGHPPNIDAAIWFVKEIFPLIRRAHPDASLSLLGSGPKPAVLELAGDGVEVVGWVSDEELKARYAAARATVVPLRFGAGIKLKTVESLASGAPLTTTSIGAQGLQGLAGACAVEDDPEKFAASVIGLLAASDSEWLAASRRQIDWLGARFHRSRQVEALQAALATAEKVRRSEPIRAFVGEFPPWPEV
jgi:GT2 family glycosyltransferase